MTTGKWLTWTAVFAATLAWGLPASGQNPVRIKKTGKVVAVSPGAISATADGKSYTLKFKPEQSVVMVTGKLKPSDLQLGTIVRLTAMLKGAVVDGEVAEVKVYTTADGYQAGVLKDAADQPATITGAIQKIKDNVLTIGAGRQRITATLAEDAKVILETKGYSICKGGEPIEFDGRTTDGSNVTALKIVITKGEPLVEPKPTGKAKKAK
ncbi:MAG: hypothetical protein SFU86_20855 [Pirellulaceae bacterium]|nr:hypothetical protein [Pirellulaceae bacterium]